MKSNSKVQILIGIVLVTLVVLQKITDVHAEAGLSEAMRTEYYFLDDQTAVSILPGGEGGEGEDLISIFKYKKTNRGSNTANISGTDGNSYETDYSTSFITRSKTTYIANNYIWSDYGIYDLNQSKVLVDGWIDCRKNKSIDNCPKWNEIWTNQNFNSYEDDKHLFDSNYIRSNLEIMGHDSFGNAMGTLFVVIVCVLIAGVTTVFTGIVLFVIGIVRKISENKGIKLMIAGALLAGIPITLFLCIIILPSLLRTN